MNRMLFFSLALSLGSAFVAVVFGQVLSRAVIAGHVAVAALGLAGLAAGGGLTALALVVFGLLWLALLQLIGWMLVDVDHDHLPALRARTLLARGLALALFAFGQLAFLRTALRRSAFGRPGESTAPIPLEPDALGAFFIGRGSEVAVVLGLLLAASLLTALRLLRDEESEHG